VNSIEIKDGFGFQDTDAACFGGELVQLFRLEANRFLNFLVLFLLGLSTANKKQQKSEQTTEQQTTIRTRDNNRKKRIATRVDISIWFSINPQ
jgi:hypothetical protein